MSESINGSAINGSAINGSAINGSSILPSHTPSAAPLPSTQPSNSDRPIQGRQRARRACLPCRQRKRKCDVEFPCSMCTRYGYNCRYPDQHNPPNPNLSPIRTILPGHNDMRHGFSSTTNHTPRRQSITNSQSPSASSQDVVDRGILDPLRSRYMSQHSAVAFPRSLGVEFQSANPPPLHSFAWNCGIRAEEAASAHTNLTQLVSFDDFKRFSDIYAATVHGPFGFLDWPYFMRRCNDYWTNQGRDLTFGAVVGGVVALGSFFAFRLGHPRELEIVQHVKTVLEDPTFSRHPSIDQINAWILRTLYLRSTTRPHVAWLASCIALHLAEATGLHQEVHSVLLTTEGDTQAKRMDQAEIERARKTFWMAWSVHTIISYEYGRSAVILNSISCKPVKDTMGDSSVVHIRIAQLIPRDNMVVSSVTHKEELINGLKELAQIPDVHPFLSLSKADVCFCFYRRLRLMKQGLEKEAIQSIIDIGNKGAEAADTFARNGHPWWNILSTTFQYFCVLLAIDTSESLSNVSWVLNIFENIVRIVDTHLAHEALDTAKVLLRDSMAKKRRDLGFLENADGQHGPETERQVDINWDALLDPTFPDALMSEEFSIYNN